MEMNGKVNEVLGAGINNMFFVIESMAALYSTGNGKAAYINDEEGPADFMVKVNQMIADGTINTKSAFILLDIYLGGLLIPETEKIDDLIAKGVSVDKAEAIEKITEADETYAMVLNKRNELWKELNG
jgi:hypothetical protein